MPRLPPLRFTPLCRQAIWGGRRLETMLGKTLGKGNDFAESWEIVDHGDDQSVVSQGPCQGISLSELVTTDGQRLLGRHHPLNQFPLLFKFLDAHRNLSVQVHPDDAAAAMLDPPDLGKTEAWVILSADPESVIYAGLKRGVDRAALRSQIDRGDIEQCLSHLQPQVGDCIFIPAGTVHALGAGLVVAEIQQSSDTTFRLFDWNRLGADGNPRDLHIEQALDAIDFQRGPIAPQQPRMTDRSHISRLVKCDQFVLDRWRFDTPESVGGDDRCHLLTVLQGEVSVEGDSVAEPLGRGQTCLLPASAGQTMLSPLEGSIMLEIALP